MGLFKQRGFTLIELMVVIAVAAVLLAVALPSFDSVVNSNRLVSAANEMVASLQTARMEAVRQNRRAEVCLSANANAGSAATCATSGVNGWITFLDINRNGAYNSGTDTLLRNSTFAGPILVSGTASVAFRSDGIARDTTTGALINGNVRFLINTTRPVQNVRCVKIGTGSGISVRTPTANNGACT